MLSTAALGPVVIGDTERKSFVGSTDVQLMMRAVTSDPYVYNPIPKMKHQDTTTNIGGLVFVELSAAAGSVVKIFTFEED